MFFWPIYIYCYPFFYTGFNLLVTPEGQLYYVFIIPEGKTWSEDKIDSYLMIGPSGAILEKKLDNFILLDGSAEVIQ